MNPVRIITSDFTLQGEIENYESAQHTRKWHGVGDMELRINRYKNHVDKLVKGSILLNGSNPNKSFIIRHREIELNEDGKVSENWIIKALALKSLIAQRITLPPSTTAYDNKQSDAETVMKHYVDRNLVNPDDPNRKIPNLVIAPNFNRGSSISWQSRFKNVAEEMENISLASGLGWDVFLDLDNKQFVFDVFEGADRVASQSVNPPVIFSPDFDAVSTQGFVDSDLNMKNFGYIAGQGEGINREVVEIGTVTGIDRIETFVDARDVETTAELNERGQQKMDELNNEFYLESEILTKSPFTYEKDYFLGDIVTIQNRGWGITRDARITEVTEIYEANGYKLEAVFGKSRPTLIDVIKRKFGEVENELKR